MASTTGNGRRTSSSARSRIELISPPASPEEAAAIVAALERFMRATAPRPHLAGRALDGWRQTAMLEAVSREDECVPTHPWINT